MVKRDVDILFGSMIRCFAGLASHLLAQISASKLSKLNFLSLKSVRLSRKQQLTDSKLDSLTTVCLRRITYCRQTITASSLSLE